MKILFVHQNFPGQFRHLAAALANDRKNQVLAIGEAENLGRLNHPHVREVGYNKADGPGPSTHHYLQGLEAHVRRGQQVARVANTLRHQGFVPDLVCCHPAWGEGLFLRDVWPNACLLYYCEFFYRSRGLDVGFDPEFPHTFDDQFKTRLRNAHQLLSLDVADWGLSPTHWQHATLPVQYQNSISVIFDGIDTRLVSPAPASPLKLQSGATLSQDDEIVTFVNRNLEPYRGYHMFMRALPRLMAERPQAQIVIVGGDDVSYGRHPRDGKTYKQKYLDEVKDQIDLSRLHYLGRVPYPTFLQVLRLSSVHVYLTYPFVLSWSMLEAMSAGCAVVASATPPVTEFISNEKNGLLFDFFSTDELIEQVCRVLDHPDQMKKMRDNARQSVVQGYDLHSVCLPRQMALISLLAAGNAPPVPSLPPASAGSR